MQRSLPAGGMATVRPVVRQTRGQVERLPWPRTMEISGPALTKGVMALASRCFVGETHGKKHEKISVANEM